MKKLMIVLVALLMVTAFVMSADAMRGGKELGYGFCKGNDLAHVEGLDLTAEQKIKITDLRANHLKDVKPIQDKLHSKTGNLKFLWQQKNFDEAKIRAASKEVKALRDQIDEKSTDYRWSVYKILTPKQQDLLKQNRTTGHCFGPGPDASKGMGFDDKDRERK